MDYKTFLNNPVNVGSSGIIYEIKPGMTLKQVARYLHERNVIDSAVFFVWVARFDGVADTIKAGEYKVMPGMTPPQMLIDMVNGNVVQYSLTLVEGWSFHQVMMAINREEVLQHTLIGLDDSAIMDKLGHSGQHPEGRFLPDTYNFSRHTTDVEFLKRAYNAMELLLANEWPLRDAELPLDTSYDALILASIIEKETSVPDERSKIAGVFTRRLQQGMRLQTDPTVIYGMGETYDGNIRRKNLKEDTPYNTYMRRGLPPTPIAMPGADSIRAALHPEQGNELYFVARGDGRHHFSATLEEHNKAVIKYQLNGKARSFSSHNSGTQE